MTSFPERKTCGRARLHAVITTRAHTHPLTLTHAWGYFFFVLVFLPPVWGPCVVLASMFVWKRAGLLRWKMPRSNSSSTDVRRCLTSIRGTRFLCRFSHNAMLRELDVWASVMLGVSAGRRNREAVEWINDLQRSIALVGGKQIPTWGEFSFQELFSCAVEWVSMTVVCPNWRAQGERDTTTSFRKYPIPNV